MSIHKIVERCKKNDSSAQTELYERIAGQLLGVCIRYVKSREIAEDCLQEAFIKIFSNIHTFKGDGPFEAWACRITVNEVLAYFRKKNVLAHSLELESVQHSVPVEYSVTDQLSHEELLRFINALPEGKRVVFNLYVIEGFSHREIAEMLNITEGTSKSQLSKAKEMLAEMHKKHDLDYAERTI